jgi:hypothetical protein
MTTHALPSIRLDLKRVFAAYMLALSSPGIADPTAAFDASLEYLTALLRALGPEEFLHRLDDETTHLAGEADQDIRRKLRGSHIELDYSEVEDRLRECFEYALGQLQQPLNARITRPR